MKVTLTEVSRTRLSSYIKVSVSRTDVNELLNRMNGTLRSEREFILTDEFMGSVRTLQDVPREELLAELSRRMR